MRIRFWLPGEVVAWARAGRLGQRSFTPREQRKFMARIRGAAIEKYGDRPPTDEPVAIKLVAVFEWPKSYSRKRRASPDGAWKTSRPDSDNLCKIVGDALQPTKDGKFPGIIADDAQVAHTAVWKVFGANPGLTVELSSLAGVAAPVC